MYKTESLKSLPKINLLRATEKIKQYDPIRSKHGLQYQTAKYTLPFWPMGSQSSLHYSLLLHFILTIMWGRLAWERMTGPKSPSKLLWQSGNSNPGLPHPQILSAMASVPKRSQTGNAITSHKVSCTETQHCYKSRFLGTYHPIFCIKMLGNSHYKEKWQSFF